jgi:hypothetical protein
MDCRFWKVICGWECEVIQALKVTTVITQQNARQVNATDTLRNIITSIKGRRQPKRQTQITWGNTDHRDLYALPRK